MSDARRRLVDTATRLFYAEGVRTVGIDRIIAEAAVAKATFYHHFKSKDDLVVAYLDQQYAAQRDDLGALPLEAIFSRLAELSCGPGFRGCPFLNVAAEFADPEHPVRKIVLDYRNWFRGLMRELLAERGHPDPESTAELLLILRDGVALSGGVGDPTSARADVRTLLQRVL